MRSNADSRKQDLASSVSSAYRTLQCGGLQRQSVVVILLSLVWAIHVTWRPDLVMLDDPKTISVDAHSKVVEDKPSGSSLSIHKNTSETLGEEAEDFTQCIINYQNAITRERMERANEMVNQ